MSPQVNVISYSYIHRTHQWWRCYQTQLQVVSVAAGTGSSQRVYKKLSRIGLHTQLCREYKHVNSTLLYMYRVCVSLHVLCVCAMCVWVCAVCEWWVSVVCVNVWVVSPVTEWVTCTVECCDVQCVWVCLYQWVSESREQCHWKCAVESEYVYSVWRVSEWVWVMSVCVYVLMSVCNHIMTLCNVSGDNYTHCAWVYVWVRVFVYTQRYSAVCCQCVWLLVCTSCIQF